MTSFRDVFKVDNSAELCLDWTCENCKNDLNFFLKVIDVEHIQWEARCCNKIYLIDPIAAVYNTVSK